MEHTKRLTMGAILTALALALSYMERFLPLQLVVPLPGVKLGLANIVTLMALCFLGGRTAVTVLVSGASMRAWRRRSRARLSGVEVSL